MTTEPGARTPARRRRHAARRSRWVVLGASGVTTAVLVGYMGVTTQDSPQVTAGTGELAGGTAAATGAATAVAQSNARPSARDAKTDTPIRQTQPSVRRLERVPVTAPSAATHGSR